VKRLSISNSFAGGVEGREGKGKGIERNKMLVKEKIKTESRSKWIDIWSAGSRSRLGGVAFPTGDGRGVVVLVARRL